MEDSAAAAAAARSLAPPAAETAAAEAGRAAATTTAEPCAADAAVLRGALGLLLTTWHGPHLVWPHLIWPLLWPHFPVAAARTIVHSSTHVPWLSPLGARGQLRCRVA